MKKVWDMLNEVDGQKTWTLETIILEKEDHSRRLAEEVRDEMLLRKAGEKSSSGG